MNYLLLIGFSILFVGIFFAWYQLYKIVSCDTKRRGLPHPKAISFILSGGQRGEGLLIYLITRKNIVLLIKVKI